MIDAGDEEEDDDPAMIMMTTEMVIRSTHYDLDHHRLMSTDRRF